MIFLFTGTDREKVRITLNAEVASALGEKKGASVVRITDANNVDDLKAVLRGAGMFGGAQVVVLDGILANEEMNMAFFDSLPALAKSSECIFMLEGKLDAETRKRVEKHAESTKKFDMVSKGKDSSIFGIANALRRADKRALWLDYQRQLAEGAAPEAIHGVLFWGAKDMLLKSRDDKVRGRAKKLVAELAELPHKARRRGEDLEYALERFVLSGV